MILDYFERTLNNLCKFQVRCYLHVLLMNEEMLITRKPTQKYTPASIVIYKTTSSNILIIPRIFLPYSVAFKPLL